MGAIDYASIQSDAREIRMDRIALLYAEITAATRAFLAALAESDRHRDWSDEGFGSCAEWLSWRCGISRNTANEKVRAARALESLPLISEAMARGELSFSKVRALTRVAAPENEAELLAFARAGLTANLERLVRGWKTLSREAEVGREHALHQTRSFSVFPDEQGMYVVKGRLDPEVGAVLMRAIEAAGDALFAEEWRGRGRTGPDEDQVDPAQRRADAVGLLAERALAAGFGQRTEVGSETGPAAAPETEAPISGSRAERYQVVLHVEAATLKEAGEPCMSELEDGTRVSAETARRLSCDASRVVAQCSEEGAVQSLGRRTRTVPPSTRRALEARDRGCRFPGCGLRFTDAHHVEHWADGGETSVRNLVLLCRRHHRRVHEDGWKICIDKVGQVVFFTPTGKALGQVPSVGEVPMAGQPPRLAEASIVNEVASAASVACGAAVSPAEAGGSFAAVRTGTSEAEASPAAPAEPLIRRNRSRGVEPHSSTCSPRWKRDGDVPWSVEAAAWEALDPQDENDDAVA